MRIVTNQDITTVELNNGMTLDIVQTAGRLLGIGAVSFQGKQLRDGSEYIMPEIATPDGWEVDYYEPIGISEPQNGLEIKTKPWFRVGHRMEWTEHAMHLRINTSSWSRSSSPEGAFLTWIIREEEEEMDGVRYPGFSYGFRYHCPGYAIYQIEDKATWELGGDIRGNTFIMRGAGDNPPAIRMEEKTYYFSGWDMPGIANPHIFQHLPLYTQLQGFTFQHDDEDILITLHERPSHVRSLFAKEIGGHKLLHFNQFCFDLTDEIATPVRKILVGRRKSGDQTSLFNHFLRVREKIQDGIRKYYGIKFDIPRPSAHVETWRIARSEQFAPIFKQLDDWGIKRTFLMPLWRSNETDILPRFAADREKFGILGNMCCPLELEIADCYGGWEGLRRILAPAVALGIETYTWFGSHFSSSSPLFDKMRDLFARDVSGQCNRNNYGHVLFAVNQNSPAYQEYLLGRFRKAKTCGLTGVFRDSHFNMATDTINYLHYPYEETGEGATFDRIGFLERGEAGEKNAILSMHDTEIAIQRRFQADLGLLYYVESQGSIGTPMCGSDYGQLRGYEFIYSDMDTGMHPDAVRAAGDDPELVYFKGLSVRLFYQIHVEVNEFPALGSVDAWWNPETMAPMVKGYMKAEPYLVRMHLLEDGRGIHWRGGEAEVIFAWKDFVHTLPYPAIFEETIGGHRGEADGKAELHKRGIYLIRREQASA